MGVSFRHHGTAGQDIAAEAPRPEQHAPLRPRSDDIDWRAVQRADHSCCCPARPMVIAIIPPSEDRPHHTELLLCGHHYQVSRQALRAARATVLDLKGGPVTDRTRPPAHAGV